MTLDTIKLASLMGVERVVMMSGLPGGKGDSNPNWIIADWPPECMEIQRYQWDEKVIPYWRDLVAYANNLGVCKLCLELHGYQAVYNVHTLMRLRDVVGETVGANYDPSHPMWMNADPLAAVRALGSAIYYVHAKDTRVEPVPAGIDELWNAAPRIGPPSAPGITSRSAMAMARVGGVSSAPSSRSRGTTTCCRSNTRT